MFDTFNNRRVVAYRRVRLGEDYIGVSNSDGTLQIERWEGAPYGDPNCVQCEGEGSACQVCQLFTPGPHLVLAPEHVWSPDIEAFARFFNTPWLFVDSYGACLTINEPVWCAEAGDWLRGSLKNVPWSWAPPFEHIPREERKWKIY